MEGYKMLTKPEKAEKEQKTRKTKNKKPETKKRSMNENSNKDARH